MTPPTVRSARPLGVRPGEATALEVRGADLDGASRLVFDDLDATVESLEPSKDRVKAKLRIPEDLAPGPRSFRVLTPRGLSNPSMLYVTRPIPAVAEKEPNDAFRAPQLVAAPSTVEGEIRGGDEVDVFAVDVAAGQTLVAEAVAERAGSGLDALVTIFSPEGRELAQDDDLFGLDAAAWVTAPASGRYLVQVQDANGRSNDGQREGRTTRGYLLALGEIPLVVSAFPPGGRGGFEARMDLSGVNVPEGLQYLFTPPATAPLGDLLLKIDAPAGRANGLTVRVGDGPETVEPSPEGSDDPLRPQPATVPGAISGRFSPKDDGDVDYYRLVPAPGLEGDYAITVLAARLGSAADPMVAVADDRGGLSAEDDDALGRDARIERRIDADGLVIAVREAFGRGGPRFVYRVEVETVAARRIVATADLGLRTVPRAGSIAVPITLERKGDDGPVTVLAGELPAGVVAAPITIPAGAKGGTLVLNASADAALGEFPIRLVGRDLRGGFEATFREAGTRSRRRRSNDDDKPDPGPPVANPRLAIAEPAAFALGMASGDVLIRPGQEAEVRVSLDRRGDPAKKPVKLRLVACEGDLDDFEAIDEAAVPADASSHTFRLKAKPDARPRRLALTARGWLEGGTVAASVAARPSTVDIAAP